MKTKETYGITLVSLVITIVVLIILSAVSISTIFGDNGLIVKSKEKVATTERRSVEEELRKIVLEYELENKNETLEEYLQRKVSEGKISEIIVNDEDGTITIRKDKYSITVDDNSVKGPRVSEIKVVANSDGSGENLEKDSTPTGTTLYITFKHSIHGGTTTVSPSIPYSVTKNGVYKFTITEIVDNVQYTKTVSITVDQFKKSYDIYAFLYSDGTLSLGSTNKTIEGKTVEEEYGNIKDEVYTNRENGNKYLEVTTPWQASGHDWSINKVIIINQIYPKNTSNWFCELRGLSSIDGIENIITSETTDMSYMFCNCNSLKSIDVSSFDTGNVTNMASMFAQGDVPYHMGYYSTLKEIKGLNNFNTSKVTDMSEMFRGLINLTELDLSSFDTSSVVNMAGMFSANDAVPYDSKLYSKLTKIKGLSNFNTSKVTDMSGMFNDLLSVTELDLSNFDTSNVINMNRMFSMDKILIRKTDSEGAGPKPDDDMYDEITAVLTDIKGLHNFNTSKVTNMSGMFALTMFENIDLSNFNTSNVTNMSNMFYDCSNLVEINLKNFDTSNVSNMSGMFKNCAKITVLNLSSFNTSNVIDMSDMFLGCGKLAYLDLSSFDTNKVKDMSWMFSSCGLTGLNISKWNVDSVTDMSYMFSYCYNLTELNLSGLNMNRVTNMKEMFYSCSNLVSIDLSNCSAENVTSLESTFEFCEKLKTLNLNNFKTNKLITMDNTFNYCESLTTLNLGGFNTCNVTSMYNAFGRCRSLTNLDLSGFDTGNVTNMSGMFYSCEKLTSLDLSSFDTSKVTSMQQMFYYTPALKKIYVGSKWTMANVTNSTNMYTNSGVSGTTLK